MCNYALQPKFYQGYALISQSVESLHFFLDATAGLVLQFWQNVKHGGCNGFVGESINQRAGGNSGGTA